MREENKVLYQKLYDFVREAVESEIKEPTRKIAVGDAYFNIYLLEV